MKEDKLLKSFLCISILFHVLLTWVPSMALWQSDPIEQEVIDIDVVNWTPPPGKKPKIDKKKALPQLPKTFKVKDTKPKTDPNQMTVKNKERQKQAKMQAKKLEAIKKQALNELSKEDYIKRLQLEQVRLEKDETQKRQAWGQYQGQLRSWITTHYSIPEVYKSQKNIQTTVELVLDKQGRILKIRLYQKSGDRTFDEIVIANLRKASPFPSPPKRLVGEPLHFEYSSKE